MKNRGLLVFCLSLLFYISSVSNNVKGDEAPIDLQGCGTYGVFVEQTNVSMERFFVNVTVDLPRVTEEFTYYLKNNQNSTCNQTVIVPTIFELEKNEYYDYENKATAIILVNNHSVDYFSSKTVILEDQDLITDMDHYKGYVFNLSFKPYETIVTDVKILTYHEDYTAEFKYFYSSKTARYWNGTIKYSYFHFKFIGDIDDIFYEVPNGTRNENEVISEMHNWDGNATYNVVVDLHHSKMSNYIWMIISFVCYASIIGLIITLILLNNRSKRKKEERQNTKAS